MKDIKAEYLDLNDGRWEHATTFAGNLRITTSRGVFTISDNGEDVVINCEQTMQTAPVAGNAIALNEYRPPVGVKRFPH